jgi:NADPH-dependent 2,4-dienoyl-CoA reductase/sulfur reductase-like enzyme
MGKGVTFHMQTTVDTIKEDPANPGVASSVVLKNGTELPADVVVLGVGVGPATEFLKEGSGIKLEKDGGVLVDEYLKVPGVDDVYAIGDIAVFPQTENPTPRRIEHWNVGPF